MGELYLAGGGLCARVWVEDGGWGREVRELLLWGTEVGNLMGVHIDEISGSEQDRETITLVRWWRTSTPASIWSGGGLPIVTVCITTQLLHPQPRVESHSL